MVCMGEDEELFDECEIIVFWCEDDGCWFVVYEYFLFMFIF